MSRTLNMRAKGFAFRALFLAEPDEGYALASMPAAQLAAMFCKYEECTAGGAGHACRRHSQTTMIGLAKLIAEGNAHAELTHRGVLYVRLSPSGVMSPTHWSSQPEWFDSKPELVEWAEKLAV